MRRVGLKEGRGLVPPRIKRPATRPRWVRAGATGKGARRRRGPLRDLPPRRRRAPVVRRRADARGLLRVPLRRGERPPAGRLRRVDRGPARGLLPRRGRRARRGVRRRRRMAPFSRRTLQSAPLLPSQSRSISTSESRAASSPAMTPTLTRSAAGTATPSAHFAKALDFGCWRRSSKALCAMASAGLVLAASPHVPALPAPRSPATRLMYGTLPSVPT